MSGIWGNKFKISIFGESHGAAIGVTIDGLPSGLKINLNNIENEMERRAPGRNSISTSRKESDKFEIISGFFNGYTTGTPLTAIIRNNDKKSKDYLMLSHVMRPSHGDYSGFLKYNGFNDYRGGGHFSGRITAPIVLAGAIAKEILRNKGIEIVSRIKSIKNISDEEIDICNPPMDKLLLLKNKGLAVLNDENASLMKEEILNAKKQGDSVGGVIQCIINGLSGGVGEPFFDSLESTIAHLAFSVPAVKGIEFGRGFDITKFNGSQINDEYYYDGEVVKASSNNNGGIVGGITNGMPISFNVAIKPTASILKEQNTVDIKEKINTKLAIEGRHDPCIVQRAIPVIEAISAIAIAELI
ncbi:chorismate synthase [Clostridium frigidicarnis]|uniref:Chorismate synthase n=1 Tax=Clostridium frigidicarnis TaxID=84698 RepID=A0A1I1AJL6_9CLOT|nr:chorismate synthase [Clostridium frigidicarnis]SFB36698.1 chorismate synthase [Clostridium frigidicarnis]